MRDYKNYLDIFPIQDIRKMLGNYLNRLRLQCIIIGNNQFYVRGVIIWGRVLPLEKKCIHTFPKKM